MQKVNKILILIIILSAGLCLSQEADFDIIVSVQFMAFDVEDIYLEPYDYWQTDTISHDTTVCMDNENVVHLENSGNVPVTVSLAVEDRPDGYFDASYEHWESSLGVSDTNVFALVATMGESPSLDMMEASFIGITDTPEIILPEFAIGETTYLHLCLTTPIATTDRYMHELIVTFEVSSY